MAIEGAVKALDGIDMVDVDVPAKSVSVEFDAESVSLDAIEAAVRDEGYEVAGHHVFGD
jgi:copper chaperone